MKYIAFILLIIAALCLVPILAVAATVVNVPIICFEGDEAKRFVKGDDYKIAGQGLSTQDAVTQVLTKDNGDFTVIVIMAMGRVCFVSGGNGWENEIILKGKKS